MQHFVNPGVDYVRFFPFYTYPDSEDSVWGDFVQGDHVREFCPFPIRPEDLIAIHLYFL